MLNDVAEGAVLSRTDANPNFQYSGRKIALTVVLSNQSQNLNEGILVRALIADNDDRFSILVSEEHDSSETSSSLPREDSKGQSLFSNQYYLCFSINYKD